MPSEIHNLHYTWKQIHTHTMKSEFMMCDHARHMEHTAQNLILYIGHLVLKEVQKFTHK